MKIGIVGLDVPAELVRAAGFRPVRLQGNPSRPSPIADRLLGKRVDSQIRSVAQSLLDGAYGQLHGLLISHDSHANLRLFAVLRALRSRGTVSVPPLHLCDLLHSPDPACARYNRTRLVELRDVLSNWAAQEVTEGDLRSQIASANRTRAALRTVSALRRAVPPQCSGSRVLATLSATWCADDVDRIDCDHLSVFPPGGRGGPAQRRVFLTGSSHDNASIYEAIEAAGCVIVGEDHDWGDPAIEFDLQAHPDPLDAFVVRLMRAPPASAKFSVEQRAAYTVSGAVAAKADSVVAYIRDGDAGPRWDVADQRRALQALGMPLLLIDDQPYQVDSAATVTAAVSSFLKLES